MFYYHRCRLKKKFYRWLIKPLLNDEAAIRLRFRSRFGRTLNLESPKTFNEKLQWIKLHDRNPLMTSYADKYEVRKIVESKLGTRVLNELYGFFEDTDEIDFDSLPESFVLKATHGSGWNIIVKDKMTMNRKEAKKKMKKWLASSYYTRSREWSYKHILPRIVCERYMENKDGSLIDYKVFCFNGTPSFIQVDLNRYSGHMRTFYSPDWQKLDFFIGNEWKPHPYEKEVKPPDSLADMMEIARRLSADFTFARIDMYDVGGKPIFGEVTFYPGGGWEKVLPEHWDEKLGDLLKLPMR